MSATPTSDEPSIISKVHGVMAGAPIPVAASAPAPSATEETPGQAAARRAREGKQAKAEAERATREGAQAQATFDKTGLRDPVAFFRGKAANLIPDATRFAVRLRNAGHLTPVGQFTARELERDADIEVFLLHRIVPKLRKTGAKSADGFYEFDVTLISAKGQETAPLEFRVFDTSADVTTEDSAHVIARLMAEQRKEPTALEKLQEMKAMQEMFAPKGGGMDPMQMMMMQQMMATPKVDPAVEMLKMQLQQQSQALHGVVEMVKELASRPPPPPPPSAPPKTIGDYITEWAPIVGPMLPALFDKLSNKEQMSEMRRSLKDLGDQINGQKSGFEDALENYKMIQGVVDKNAGGFGDFMKKMAPGLISAVMGGGGMPPGAPGGPTPAQMQELARRRRQAQIQQIQQQQFAEQQLLATQQQFAQGAEAVEMPLPAAPPPPHIDMAPPQSAAAPAQPAPPTEEQMRAQMEAMLRPPPEFAEECGAKIAAAKGPGEMADAVVESLRWLTARNPVWAAVMGELQRLCFEMLADETPPGAKAAAREKVAMHLTKYLSAMEELKFIKAPVKIRVLAACEGLIDDIALDLMTAPDDAEAAEAEGDDGSTPA